jgi:MFS family permease
MLARKSINEPMIVVDSPRAIGMLSLVLILASASFLRTSSPNWTPRGWRPSTEAAKTSCKGLSPHEMIKSRTFYGLWTCFALGTLAGLLAAGAAKPVGLEVVEKAGLPEEKASPLITELVALSSLFSGIGRPLFGYLADKMEHKRLVALLYTLIAMMSMLIYLYPASLAVYVISFTVFWMSLGGWLVITPALTVSLFGARYLARNYGFVFTAFGAGAIMGNILIGQAKDAFGTYIGAFPYVAGFAITGLVIALTTLRPINREGSHS